MKGTSARALPKADSLRGRGRRTEAGTGTEPGTGDTKKLVQKDGKEKGKMLKFAYFFELKEGYHPIMSEYSPEEETCIRIIIEAENRATADRAIKALLKGAGNVEYCSAVCLD